MGALAKTSTSTRTLCRSWPVALLKSASVANSRLTQGPLKSARTPSRGEVHPNATLAPGFGR